MNKTKVKNLSLKGLFKEVRVLRQDVDMFIPTESLEEYKNKKEILDAYRDAKQYMARVKRV